MPKYTSKGKLVTRQRMILALGRMMFAKKKLKNEVIS